ncbi:MAG: hypothetical protein BIFFINMI_03566 [Phycisphaerae bacterium]|nr:hypothetical protein [Phycisphaerae bacterium]
MKTTKPLIKYTVPDIADYRAKRNARRDAERTKLLAGAQTTVKPTSESQLLALEARLSGMSEDLVMRLGGITTGVRQQDAKSLQDGDISEQRASTYWLVISNTPLNAYTASEATGVPDYYDEHPSTSSMLCKAKRTRSLGAEADRYYWEVQCDYSDQIQLPLYMPAVIEWDFSTESEDYFFDADGDPVVNSAGTPFDAQPQRDKGVITATCTKNVATSFDLSYALSFGNAVNSDSFTLDGVSISAGQAKIALSIGGVQTSNGEDFRTVKINFKFKPDWDDHFADVGYYQLNGSGKAIPITTGTPPKQVEKPYPLNGSGAKKTNPTDTPAELTFKPYNAVPFSDLSGLLT